MARNHKGNLFAAPSGKGRGMPAAGALFPWKSIRPTQAPGSISTSLGGTITALAIRMDRRDITSLHYSSVSAPPSHQMQSYDVPFSPDLPAIDRISSLYNSLRGSSLYHNLSNHISSGVDLNTSAPNTCARTDRTTIDGFPGTPYPIPGPGNSRWAPTRADDVGVRVVYTPRKELFHAREGRSGVAEYEEKTDPIR
jgi:hypothetical protein